MTSTPGGWAASRRPSSVADAVSSGPHRDVDGPAATVRRLERTRAVEPGWRASDAWFFEAVAWAAGSEPADLAAVIAAGDAINHAILTAYEIRGAVRRLAAAGLIEVFAKRFTLTARGESLRRPAERKGAVERMAWLELQFRRLTPSRNEPDFELGDEEYRLACESHVGKWASYRRREPRP